VTKRGLFFCAAESCYLAPEIWRNGFGLCQKHAIEYGVIEAPPSKPKFEKRQSYLDRLLNEIDAEKYAPPVPTSPPLARNWWDNDGLPF
jgi:hypothetical protein